MRKRRREIWREFLCKTGVSFVSRGEIYSGTVEVTIRERLWVPFRIWFEHSAIFISVSTDVLWHKAASLTAIPLPFISYRLLTEGHFHSLFLFRFFFWGGGVADFVFIFMNICSRWSYVSVSAFITYGSLKPETGHGQFMWQIFLSIALLYILCKILRWKFLFKLAQAALNSLIVNKHVTLAVKYEVSVWEVLQYLFRYRVFFCDYSVCFGENFPWTSCSVCLQLICCSRRTVTVTLS